MMRDGRFGERATKRSLSKKVAAVLLATVVSLFLFLPSAMANVVTNGDFSNGLSGWTFDDDSRDAGTAEAYAEGGRAVIHARCGHGEGVLYQEISRTIVWKIKEISIDYEAYSPSGHCNGVEIKLMDGGTVVAGFLYWEDSSVPRYSAFSVTLLGETYDLRNQYDPETQKRFRSGTVRFVFHHPYGYVTGVDVIVETSSGSETLKTVSKTIAPPFIDRIELRASSNCCDGRNDSYGYFDNVSITPRRGYILHYPFDNCNAYDESGNGNDGVLYGNPSCVSGASGNALHFDGVDDKVKVNKMFSFYDFTISMWIRTSYDGVQQLVSMADGSKHGMTGVGIGMLNGNDLEIGYRAVEDGDKCEIHAKNYNLADNEWHLVTVVRDTSKATGYLYIDGELAGSYPDPAPDRNIPAQSYTQIGYGYYYTRGDMFFHGDIDDVRFYNYPLSADEVRDLYNQASPSPSNSPPVLDSFSADPTSGDAPLTVSFSCSGHDSDGYVDHYTIDFGDGESETTSSGTTSHTYNYEGSYTATCVAVDDNGDESSSRSVTISVTSSSSSNSPPERDSFTANPISGNAPLTVNFSCSGHDDDGYVSYYIFTFGDGSSDTSTTGHISHTYNSPGSYVAECVPVDDDGEEASFFGLVPTTITVSPSSGGGGGSGRAVPSQPTIVEVSPADAWLSMGPDAADGVLTSGEKMDLVVNFPEYQGPVDVYAALWIPPQWLLFLNTDNQFVFFNGSFPPFRLGVTGPFSFTFFEDLPIANPLTGECLLPNGYYGVYMIVVPAGEDLNTINWDTDPYLFEFYIVEMRCSQFPK